VQLLLASHVFPHGSKNLIAGQLAVLPVDEEEGWAHYLVDDSLFT